MSNKRAGRSSRRHLRSLLFPLPMEATVLVDVWSDLPGLDLAAGDCDCGTIHHPCTEAHDDG
jgi:hypothetical protein